MDVTRNGRRTPALGLISKTAYMFILDRATGAPVHGVEERPVPKGEVPGECMPTQPFPVRPASAGTRRLQKGGHGDGGRHDAGAREELSRALGQSRRLLQRRAIHAVPVSRGRRAAEDHHPVSWQWRHELGRPCWRSDARLHLRIHPGCGADRLGREKARRRQLRQRQWIAAAHDRGSITDLARIQDSARRWDPDCRRGRVSVRPGDA